MKDNKKNWQKVRAEQRRINQIRKTLKELKDRIEGLKGEEFMIECENERIEVRMGIKKMKGFAEEIEFWLEQHENYTMNSIYEVL